MKQVQSDGQQERIMLVHVPMLLQRRNSLHTRCLRCGNSLISIYSKLFDQLNRGISREASFLSEEAEFLIQWHEYSLLVFGEKVWAPRTRRYASTGEFWTGNCRTHKVSQEAQVPREKPSDLSNDDKSDAGTMENSNNEKKLQFDYGLTMNRDVKGDALHSVMNFIRSSWETSTHTTSDL